MASVAVEYATVGEISGGGGGCCKNGPGYATPLDAMSGPKEALLYVTCVYSGTGREKPDYLATVDVDPNSPTYSKVIHRLPVPHIGDELHHTGWNSCSSCHGDASAKRRFLVMPSLVSGRIYVVDTQKNPKAPSLHKVVEPESIIQKTGLAYPHTSHCLASGDILVSCLGDKDGNAEGNGFLLLDSEFNVKGRWEKPGHSPLFGYDFWYQPRHKTMISSSWGAPLAFTKGFDLQHVADGLYGRHLYVYSWPDGELKQTMDLGNTGLIPLEIRFLHDPSRDTGYVGCALTSNMVRFFKTADGSWSHEVCVAKPAIWDALDSPFVSKMWRSYGHAEQGLWLFLMGRARYLCFVKALLASHGQSKVYGFVTVSTAYDVARALTFLHFLLLMMLLDIILLLNSDK